MSWPSVSLPFSHLSIGQRLEVIMGEATPMLLFAKLGGALAGSLISLAYVLPRGRREAMLRLLVGIVSGFVFGSTAGVKLADMLDVLDRVSVLEITLMGAALTSLCAWWSLGVLQRLAEYGPAAFRTPFPKLAASKPDQKKDSRS